MMHTDIVPPHVPKKRRNAVPYVVACLCVLAIGFAAQHKEALAAIGGPQERVEALAMHEKEEEMRRLRAKQAVLERREEILRYQLHLLDIEQKRSHTTIDPRLQEQFRRSRNMLVMLLRDQRENDERVALYLRQVWEAEGRARVAAMGAATGVPSDIYLSWPVEPIHGISAHFHDDEYEKIFGLTHKAVDIPIEQNSTIMAAADGVVETVALNGMGYSYVIVRHDGFATLYGHITDALIEEGDVIQEGQPIALSGGRPGTAGAGAISTGPHVHFEVIVAGQHEDPMAYLPDLEGGHS